jgi:nicotinamidase-related amidase
MPDLAMPDLAPLDPRTTAVILIDVQHGTLAMPLAPYDGATIVANAGRLATRAQAAGAVLVLVRIAFSAGYADRLQQPVDVPLAVPPGGLPAGWSELAPPLAALTPDVAITKRQWSAFHGTELDLQLRRRSIARVVIGGLMTNFGVESTARDAYQHNYAVIVAEDACASFAPELHRFATTQTLPRISQVRSTEQIVAAL